MRLSYFGNKDSHVRNRKYKYLNVTMSVLPLVKLYSYRVLWKYVISCNMHPEGTYIETGLNNKPTYSYKVRKVVIRLLRCCNIAICCILLRCVSWYSFQKAYRLFTDITITDFSFQRTMIVLSLRQQLVCLYNIHGRQSSKCWKIPTKNTPVIVIPIIYSKCLQFNSNFVTPHLVACSYSVGWRVDT